MVERTDWYDFTEEKSSKNLEKKTSKSQHKLASIYL